MPDYPTMLQLMTLHTSQAHPAPTQAPARPTTKVDKRPRPEARQDMSEHDWRFYLSEWEDYKRAVGVTGQDLLDELWSCMAQDLKRLAFDQGGKESLTSEALMLARIRQLAVSVLHGAVHTVNLHDARQAPEESTKSFAARVRGIAANCALAKDCACGQKISFLEETVYHVVLAGLRDTEMQERCLSAAIMKTITNISSLVEFCSAEESGRMSNPTVGGLRSSYKKSKGETLKKEHRPGSSANSTGRCEFCGGAPHSSSSRGAREKECRAFKLVCHSCSKVGHLSPLCRSSSKPTKVAVKNAAIVEKAETVQTQQEAAVEAFAFCGILAAPVQNRFQALASLGDAEMPRHQSGVTQVRCRPWRPRKQVQGLVSSVAGALKTGP